MSPKRLAQRPRSGASLVVEELLGDFSNDFLSIPTVDTVLVGQVSLLEQELNGVKVSHLGLGLPNGNWLGGIFTQSPSGSPFEGFRWRSDASLNLNWIWLQNYSPDDPAGFTGTMKFAHVVAARTYIGCLAP